MAAYHQSEKDFFPLLKKMKVIHDVWAKRFSFSFHSKRVSTLGVTTPITKSYPNTDGLLVDWSFSPWFEAHHLCD